VLAQEIDYNRYCYIVAGTVGYMSTELVVQQYRLPDKVAHRLLDTCEACGRSLQKINIVKDFARDLERRVCYLPDEWLQEIGYTPLLLRGAPPTWIRKVVMDILHELEVATDYLTVLPYQAAGYRMAGLLSLLPTYQTLLLAAQQQAKLFTGKHHFKISRLAMAQCIWDARRMVSNNQAVRQVSQQLSQAIIANFDEGGRSNE
jgi:phytoene/squalene synthetase